jgi:hypothetical protein
MTKNKHKDKDREINQIQMMVIIRLTKEIKNFVELVKMVELLYYLIL